MHRANDGTTDKGLTSKTEGNSSSSEAGTKPDDVNTYYGETTDSCCLCIPIYYPLLFYTYLLMLISALDVVYVASLLLQKPPFFLVALGLARVVPEILFMHKANNWV